MAAEKKFTQEELDHLIGERLAKEESKHAEASAELQRRVEALESEKNELEKTITDNQDKYANYDKTIEELNAKVKGYETDSVKTAIAHEFGVPYELKQFLSGDTEEEIRKSAELISKYAVKKAPQKQVEPDSVDDKTKGLKDMLGSMFND